MPAHLIAENGPFQGTIFNLEEGEEWIIGRDDESSDFVLEDSTVSRKHVKLTKEPDGIYLKNISRVNPTLINDEEQREKTLLKEGDRIQIGSTTFLFSKEEIPNLGVTPKKQTRKTKNYDAIFEDLETPSEKESLPPTEALEEISPSENSVYDTIFEDLPEADNEPFQLIAETPFLLKVLSGPNAGAEIGINKGDTYIIGKEAESCDIVFQDLSVSRMHARLSVSLDGVIEIEDLGSKNGTVVNGVPIQEKTILTAQDTIAMGTTIFLLIDREAPQETIYAQLPLPTEEKTTEESEQKEVEAPKKDWKKDPIPPKYLIAGGAVVLIFLIAFFSFFSLFKSQDVDTMHKEPISHIKDALEDPKFRAIQFSFNPASGKLFLVGHILTQTDYLQMRYALSQIPFITSTEDAVVIDDGVAKTMNDVLSGNPAWRSISIRVIDPGKFIATGYLQTNAEMIALSDYLVVNFPYLDRLETKIAVEENLTTQLNSMLLSHGFSAVTLQLSNGEIVLSGVYSEKKESDYAEMIKQMNALSGITSVRNFAIPTKPNLAGINLSKDYQVSGSVLYDGTGMNAIINGKIYTLNDFLDGMKITHIESNTILLEKDGVKYRINYTR